MRAAVIGAGMTGLTAAYRLAEQGVKVDVYERWPGLGGQVATFPLGSGHLLERYYHVLMTTDVDILDLYEELEMAEDIEWTPSSVAILSGGQLHPFTSPFDLLQFTPMSLYARIRMGLKFLRLDRRPEAVHKFEAETARDWVSREMGPEAWSAVWGPLLRAKFGDRGDEVSMAWLWKKFVLRRPLEGEQRRREVLGYPQGSWQRLLERLSNEITSRGGRVLIDQPAAVIESTDSGFRVVPGSPDSFRRGHDPREFAREEAEETYDAVLCTVPSDIFLALLDDRLQSGLGAEYQRKLEAVEYHTALCLLLVLDRPFTSFYWTNIADAEIPFVGLIEHTNLVGAGAFGGRHILYVANYVNREDPLLKLSPDELLDLYWPHLARIHPGFERHMIAERWLFSEPAAQPVVTVGYERRIPQIASPVPGLYLANTTQIYPEDRGTNYSVALGTRAASLMQPG